MPANVVRLSHGDTVTTAIVEIEARRDGLRWVDRWRVILRPQMDFNDRCVGYRVWVRRDEALPRTEEDALAAACRLIEQITAAMEPPARALRQAESPSNQ
jgi:hypothetical protein